MKNFDFENKLYVITDSVISKGRTNEEVVREAIKGGAEVIELREQNWNAVKVREEAKKLLKICREHNVLFILNEYVDVALEIGADGVRIEQASMTIEKARAICGDRLIIGLSTHSIEQAIDADQEDIDFIAIGQIYKTKTNDNLVGPEIIKPVLDHIDKPLIAIGGINKENIDEVLQQGVKCIAVTNIVAADDISKAASELANKIKRA